MVDFAALVKLMGPAGISQSINGIQQLLQGINDNLTVISSNSAAIAIRLDRNDETAVATQTMVTQMAAALARQNDILATLASRLTGIELAISELERKQNVNHATIRVPAADTRAPA